MVLHCRYYRVILITAISVLLSFQFMMYRRGQYYNIDNTPSADSDHIKVLYNVYGKRTSIPIQLEEIMLIEPHNHLKAYQSFLENAAPQQINNFQLTAVTLFDHDCYKTYLDENIKIIERVWNKWINSYPVNSEWQLKKCGPSYVKCDRDRWDLMLRLFNENEQRISSGGTAIAPHPHQLYSHLDPDFFLLDDFSILKWLSDCQRFGFAFRQMSTNFFTTPWISMSHACFSHKVIQLLTPDLIVSYLDNHQDMQIALYALVERELFDDSFSDMIKFSEIGSIYSERIGNKLEKPSKCTDNLFHPGGTAPPLSSIHLSSCKGRREYQHECLQKIRQFDTSGSFRNWKFYNVADYTALAGSAKRSMGG